MMPTVIMRRQFVLARSTRAEEMWEFEKAPGHEAPLRFFAGFDKRGRVKTRSSINRDVWFFYDSPFLKQTFEKLRGRMFLVHEIQVLHAPERV